MENQNLEKQIHASSLIADFMDCQKSDYVDSIYVMSYMKGEPHYLPSLMQYNKNWEWLMPVVEKICKTKIGDGVEYVEYPYLRAFGMINPETGNYMVRFNGFQLFENKDLLQATWDAVIDFVQWFNLNTTYTSPAMASTGEG